MNAAPRLARALVTAALVAVAGSALGQAHERTVGRFTLRASVAPSTSVAASTAREHGVAPAAGRSLLNVTVLERHGGGERTVAADVDARIVDLLGVRHAVQLRAVHAEHRVSYFGSFTHAPGTELEFTIHARPRGGERRLELSFRERMAP